MGELIVTEPLTGNSVYGVRQVQYTVDGRLGKSFADAVAIAAFKQAAAIEASTSSYTSVVKARQKKIDELTMLFETADLVKFAKYSVGVSENDHNLISAIDFINTTKQENAPTEERIEPTVTEKDKQTIRNRRILKWSLVGIVLATVALLVYVVWELILLCF